LLKVVGNTFTGRLYNLTNRDLDFSSRCQFIKNGGVIETSYINEYIPPNAYVEFSAYVSKGEELTTADLRWIPIGTYRAFDPVNVPVWSAAGDLGEVRLRVAPAGRHRLFRAPRFLSDLRGLHRGRIESRDGAGGENPVRSLARHAPPRNHRVSPLGPDRERLPVRHPGRAVLIWGA